MNIGFALCGSFCTFASVFATMENLSHTHQLIPILSHSAYTFDSRFGTAKEHIRRVTEICGREPLFTINQVEPIGPKSLLDALIIAPCTGTTLAKLACGISDTPVLLAAKGHLRNNKPLIIHVSSNDALANNFKNLGQLMNLKNLYFVPFGQDNYLTKPNSLVAHPDMILPTLEMALDGKQIQPVIV